MGAEAGRGGVSGLVTCQLTLAAAAEHPGETVTALLQVSCSQPEAMELQEVEIDFSGIERIDTSWVQPTYRRDTPPINADKRKVQRYVVQSRLQATTQGTFSDLRLRRFVVRFTLPGWLPPTFRGIAVRYLYYLQAIVKYRTARSQETSSHSGSSDGVAAAPAGAVATRIPLHIWPAKLQPDSTAEHSPALTAGGSGNASSSLLSTAIQPEDMPIKCWEIGPGTVVQDAVAHIVKLAIQPPASNRPHSPGGRLVQRPGGGALLGAGSLGSMDDSRSEIIHDTQQGEQQPEEVEVLPTSGGRSGAPVAGTAAPLPLQQRTLGKQQQQAGQQAAQQTPLSSGVSTPHSRLPPRRPSLSRPSLDASGSPVGLVTSCSPAQLHDRDSGSTLRSFALRIGDQPLVRVSLHPPLEGSLQPGSTLAGTLDFTQLQAPAAAPAAPDDEAGAAAPMAAPVPAGPSPCCVQVLILLETEEVVEQPWRRQVRGSGSDAIRRVYDEHLEMTADTACTHFLFTIPPDAAASFQTPLMHLRWLLRFQFIASMPVAAAAASEEWNPLQGRLEQLTWVLPVTVLPPS